MVASLPVAIAGEPMQLLADRAMYWPARRRLLIADLHLGKGDAFRRGGIALPRGGTAFDLMRLSRLVQRTDAAELWILGDVLHGAAHHSAWQATWHQWRERHAALAVAALVGNHDRALAPAGLQIEMLGEAVDDGPFALCHAPQTHDALHVMCGHLHPQIVMAGLPRRWPCFWLTPRQTVLPAFSDFTGGSIVSSVFPSEHDADARFVVCGGDWLQPIGFDCDGPATAF